MFEVRLRALMAAFRNEHCRGVTLIEVIIASVIALIVAAAIFTFVSMMGKSVESNLTEQQFMTESSFFMETIDRAVRAGNAVALFGGPPTGFIVAGQTYRIVNDGTFRLGAGIDAVVIPSPYKCRINPLTATFRLLQANGATIGLIYTLELISPDGTHYTIINGAARCKNGTLF
jgi:prepilin-type N-terminal cleavage/methylation domain-containing protein